jgi:hypothetical protein
MDFRFSSINSWFFSINAYFSIRSPPLPSYPKADDSGKKERGCPMTPKDFE